MIGPEFPRISRSSGWERYGSPKQKEDEGRGLKVKKSVKHGRNHKKPVRCSEGLERGDRWGWRDSHVCSPPALARGEQGAAAVSVARVGKQGGEQRVGSRPARALSVTRRAPTPDSGSPPLLSLLSQDSHRCFQNETILRKEGETSIEHLLSHLM